MSGSVPERVLEFLTRPDAEPFDALALDCFAYQFSANTAYRRWCESLGVDPASVRDVADIPAVPVPAFKELDLTCGPPVAEFRTSGTTDGSPGRHLLPSLEPYRRSALTQFRRCVLPEGWTLRTFVLAAPPALRPNSSLSRMFQWILEECADPGGGWFVGPNGLEGERLAGALLDAKSANVPVLLAGTTAAFLAFFRFCAAERIAVALPSGSRLVDTGGRKGTGEPAGAGEPLAEFQAGFRRRVGEALGIPDERCVNEYGMTELCSQFYDGVLLARHEGRAEAPGTERAKISPPWTRTWVVDPVTLAPAGPGVTGLLRHLDLANVGSVAAVLTEDYGRGMAGGFVLEGRPRAAEARGCGLSFGTPGAGGSR